MNNEFRNQIIVALRAEGADEATKAREALEEIRSEVEKVTRQFVAGEVVAQKYVTTLGSLGRQANFFEAILEESQQVEEAIGRIDVGLHQLQVSGIKFGDSLDAAAVKQVSAIQRAEDAWAQAVNAITMALDRENAAVERAAQVTLEAEAEQERIAHQYAVSLVDGLMDAEAARRRDAEGTKLQAKEQAHLNAILQEGVEMERTQARVMTGEQQAAHVTLQQETLRTSRMLAGMNMEMDRGTRSSSRLGYGLLNISHAIQDAQYGFGAVLNNIPLVVQALGGGPGLGGVVMTLGVGLTIASEHAGSLATMLGLAADPATKLGNTLEEVKQKIEAIHNKPIMFEVDYQRLEEAELRLKRLQKQISLVEGTKETKAQRELSREAQEITTEDAGGSDALVKAVFEHQAEMGINHGTQADVNIERRTPSLIRHLREKQKDQNWVTRQVTELAIGDFQRRADAAAERNRKANVLYAQEQVGAFLQGDPAAIQAMKNLAQFKPGAFTPQGRERIAGMHGSAKELREKREAAEAADAQIEELEDSNRLWKEHQARKKQALAGRKRDAAEQVAIQDKARDEQERAVSGEARRIGQPLDRQHGPGSLEMAVLGRISRKEDDATIRAGLHGQVARTATEAGVDPQLVDLVADQVIDQVIGKLRAEAAAQGVVAGGGAAGGASNAMAMHQDEAFRQQDRREGHERKRNVHDFEEGLAGQIQAETGMNPQAAHAAAHEAVEKMQHGWDMQSAVWASVLETMKKLVDGMEHAQAQMMGFHVGFRDVSRRAGALRTMRPPVRPTLQP